MSIDTDDQVEALLNLHKENDQVIINRKSNPDSFDSPSC